MLDINTVSAGGGTLARVDAYGALSVGPRSAGAVPGPACYGRGGTEPAVTDAALKLGLLGAGELAGDVRLVRGAAEAALAPLAEALGFDTDQVARGMLQITTANMAGAIREITVERGVDPRGAALMPFGGAGPLFLSLLARDLGIRTIVLPPYAGNFSAWGLLGADLTQSAARTRVRPVTPEGVRDIALLAGELFAVLEERVQRDERSVEELRLDMRYVGQEHTLTVLVEDIEDVERLREQFRDSYERTFSLRMEADVEIVATRVTIRTPLPRGEVAFGGGDPSRSGEPQTTRAWSFRREEWVDFAVLRRESLAVGETVTGPAILLEETATAYLDEGFHGVVDPSGCVIITDTEAS
jgi:N-methylhydantoinase A